MTLLPLVSSSASASCSLCVGGNDVLFVNRSKTFTDVPGLLMKTCGELVDVAELLDAGSRDCKSLQTWGTYCDCPVPQDACTICEPGLVPFYGTMPLRQLKPLSAEFDIFGATSFTILTCDAFNSALNVLAKQGDAFCTHARTLNNGLQKCGCADPNSTGVGIVDDMPVFFDPNATESPTPAPVSVCTVCPQGNDAMLVNITKEIHLPGLLVKTCGELVEAASLFQADSSDCQSIRTLASYCGCPAPSNACQICPPGDISFFPNAQLRQINASDYHIFGALPGTTVTCEILDSALHVLAVEGDALCQATHLKNNGLQKCACAPPNSTGVYVTDDQPTFVSMTPIDSASSAPVAPTEFGNSYPVEAASQAPQPSPVLSNGSYGSGGGESNGSGNGKSSTSYGGNSKSSNLAANKGGSKRGYGKSTKSGKGGTEKNGKGKNGGQSDKQGKSETAGGKSGSINGGFY